VLAIDNNILLMKTMGINKDNSSSLEKSLYALADNMNSVVVREHQILQRELGQMCELVSDAAKTLVDNFDIITKLAAEQAELLHVMTSDDLDDAEGNEGRRGKATEISKKMQTSNSAVVRALQFEDIVQQLASHSRKRAEQMEQLFSNLSRKLEDQKKVESQQYHKVMQSVKAMQQEVEKHRVAMDKENPVKQVSISEGKTELF